MNRKIKILALEIGGYVSSNLKLTTSGNTMCLIVNNPNGGYITINYKKPYKTIAEWNEDNALPIKWKSAGTCVLRDYAFRGTIGPATEYPCSLRSAVITQEQFDALCNQDDVIVKNNNFYATSQVAELMRGWKAEGLI